MPDLTELAWFFLFGFAGWYWWKARAVKEVALHAAKVHCRKMGVMLLDEAVFLRGFWFKRDPEGRLRVWRRFLFEFATTGQHRYTGRVVLLGWRVESIQLDVHRMDDY
jgi:hypothetical protein